MMNTRKLAGRTVFITGASRHIGKAVTLNSVKDGAKIVTAKSVHPVLKLPAEDSGSNKVDTPQTDSKQCVLMHDLSTKGTLRVSLPYIKKSSISSLNRNQVNSTEVKQVWFKDHFGYTMPTCGVSMYLPNMSEELKRDVITINAAWPRTSNRNLTPFLDINSLGAIFKNHRQIKWTNQKRLMSSQAGDGGIDGIFTSIKGKLNADIVNATQAVFQFNLSGGDKEETYHIDLRNGEGAAGKGKPADTPDATLTMNTENFQKLFAGKLKPTAAFMTGKLKISGNMQKAMKLEKLLTSLKANK